MRERALVFRRSGEGESGLGNIVEQTVGFEECPEVIDNGAMLADYSAGVYL